MKITVFTSNQPRHLALVNRLADVSSTTYAVLECSTVFPGKVEDSYKKTDVMRRYFEKVIAAENALYGNISFSKSNVRTLAIKKGDLSMLGNEHLKEALCSDLYVVFGASYIKGWLIDYLVSKKAINIHMGVSPYYRGSACNFWALYDNKPEYVGATVHLLSKGLDSGPVLYHALPVLKGDTPFEFTMRAVEAAQESLVERISSNQIFDFQPQEQDRSQEIRYAKKSDFTDEVADEFLKRNLDGGNLASLLDKAVKPQLIAPFYR
ncbi:MAG: formyltransferase family protein [Deltaproteobacteria bacterium]|nr:formyltransferase family protein [Deltaproteobacteria bacterium]